jgi:uncharacterized protein (DUF1697 family)
MTTWIALLRGINVGGNNLLPMKDLVVELEEIGCTCVNTYIQSGNVTFRKSGSKAPQLAKLIGKTVLIRHGFEPKIHLLTVRELEKAVASNPFPDAVEDPKSLHLFFLSSKPKSLKRESLDEIKAERENYLLNGTMFYLHAPNGIGRSKLAAKTEKLLGVDATARNWRTVLKLLELANRKE